MKGVPVDLPRTQENKDITKYPPRGLEVLVFGKMS